MARELNALAAAVGQSLEVKLRPQGLTRVAGGSINECYRWPTHAGHNLFVKVSSARRLDMFEAEAAGLEELRSVGAVRVPAVLGHGATSERAWLVLEWLELGRPGPRCQTALGEELARQHRASASAFGWKRDNTIGTTPQLNRWQADWVEFLREQRLGYQLERARRNGHAGRLQSRGERLLESLGQFFATPPIASLLHGDLWGGNWAADECGHPVIFDPAVYYGDREADLAMTRLFGGFGDAFYAAYDAVWPLDPGARVRTDLYNLYHVLNHLNLFGAGYLAQAHAMIEGLLAELGH